MNNNPLYVLAYTLFHVFDGSPKSSAESTTGSIATPPAFVPTVNLPDRICSPSVHNVPPMPTPPMICAAPVVVEIDASVPVTLRLVVLIFPCTLPAVSKPEPRSIAPLPPVTVIPPEERVPVKIKFL